MAELWGLQAIARRLGCDRKTVVRFYEREAFPMLTRRRGSHPRRIWWTEESLITAWLLAKIERERRKRRGRFSGRGELSG